MEAAGLEADLITFSNLVSGMHAPSAVVGVATFMHLCYGESEGPGLACPNAACEKRGEFEKGMELLTAMHAAGHTAAPSNYAWFIAQVHWRLTVLRLPVANKGVGNRLSSVRAVGEEPRLRSCAGVVFGVADG